jgi:hypothetical protein
MMLLANFEDVYMNIAGPPRFEYGISIRYPSLHLYLTGVFFSGSLSRFIFEPNRTMTYGSLFPVDTSIAKMG